MYRKAYNNIITLAYTPGTISSRVVKPSGTWDRGYKSGTVTGNSGTVGAYGSGVDGERKINY